MVLLSTKKTFRLSLNRILTLMFLIALVSALSACGKEEERAYNVSTNPAVEKQASALFAAMQSGDDEAIISQYNKAFFAKRSKQAWLEKIKALMAERGPIRSFKLARSQADTRFSGKFYILEYNTVHTGNKRLHHTVTLLLPVSGGDIQLIGHKMTPWEAKEAAAETTTPAASPPAKAK